MNMNTQGKVNGTYRYTSSWKQKNFHRMQYSYIEGGQCVWIITPWGRTRWTAMALHSWNRMHEISLYFIDGCYCLSQVLALFQIWVGLVDRLGCPVLRNGGCEPNDPSQTGLETSMCGSTQGAILLRDTDWYCESWGWLFFYFGFRWQISRFQDLDVS